MWFLSKRGNSALEVGLLLPWMVFSFASVLDFGFAAYGLIATQNAARIAAMWGSATSANATSSNFASTACQYALDSLQYAPQVGTSVNSCGGTSPVAVTTATSAVGTLTTVQVTVTYTLKLLSIPGVMPGTIAISRTVQLPVRN